MNERKSRAAVRLMSSSKRIIIVVVLILMAVLVFKGIVLLKTKQLEYDKKTAYIESLNEEIDLEEDKIKQLENTKNKTITDEDYESLAREELGLIKKDEIVIKPR